MSSTALTFEGAVASLAFNRPEKRNALDTATWRAIPDLVAQAVDRRDTRVLVIRGAGQTFAAGADIAEFDRVFAGRAATLDYLDLMSAATHAIEAAPIPVVAFIEGLCFGAGVAIALSCDMRVAAPGARFAITPAKLGLMYSLADTKRVVDAVGASRAKDLLFTGRTIGAQEALAIGLVDAIEPDVAPKAAQIAQLSSWTHARTKAVVRQLLEGVTHEDEQSRGWFADAVEGPDYREGLAAFRERRPPRFGSR